jgi:hypothetical protein
VGAAVAHFPYQIFGGCVGAALQQVACCFQAGAGDLAAHSGGNGQRAAGFILNGAPGRSRAFAQRLHDGIVELSYGDLSHSRNLHRVRSSTDVVVETQSADRRNQLSGLLPAPQWGLAHVMSDHVGRGEALDGPAHRGTFDRAVGAGNGRPLARMSSTVSSMIWQSSR